MGKTRHATELDWARARALDGTPPLRPLNNTNYIHRAARDALPAAAALARRPLDRLNEAHPCPGIGPLEGREGDGGGIEGATELARAEVAVTRGQVRHVRRGRHVGTGRASTTPTPSGTRATPPR